MLMVALVFANASRLSAQDIVLRLVNSKSGKPLKNVAVSMFCWNGPPKFQADKVPKSEVIEHGVTDAKGNARFHTNVSGFEHIRFSIDTPWDFAGCWSLNDVSAATVLRVGTVASYDEEKCGKAARNVSAKPGEVVIFEKKLTIGEKVHRELP
jgi:hypothetical protein